MDRFLIKWYFYYHKGGEFYMVPQKFRKNSLQVLKISVKARFPILKLPFSFNFIYCMLWFWQRFWEPCNIFFWIFMVPYKIPHLCNNKNTIWLKIYTCFLSEITIYNFPTCPGWPCRISAGLDENCGFFTNSNVLGQSTYFLGTLYYIQVYTEYWVCFFLHL